MSGRHVVCNFAPQTNTHTADMLKPNFWKWPLLMVAALCIACGGDDEPATPGKDDNEDDNEVELPAEPPVVENEIYTAAPAGTGAYRDTYLTLEFRTATPSLGTSGLIRIFGADGAEVDRIDMADVAAVADGVPQLVKTSLFTTAMDALGTPALGRYRIVHYNPVRIEGNRVTIKPHYGVLEYDATYTVVIDADAIVAEGFEGVAAGEWSFTTKSAPASRSAVTVGESDCDFRTVQAALDYAYECGRDQAVTIDIRNGIYEEQLYLRNNNNVTLRGESREGTVIRYDNCELYASGVGGGTSTRPALGAEVGASGGRAVMLVENCDMLRFENLTLENTHGSGSQAEALYNNDNNGTGRLVFVGCDILGAQDTLNLKGYGWFYDCLVAGDVDFIWGSPATVLFEACEIRSVNGGYLVQARCLERTAKGFVFLGCDLTEADGSNGSAVYFARSSGSADYYDNVAFIDCTVGDHIAAQGWYANPAPNPVSASASAGWKEYGLTCGSAPFASTSAYCHALTQAEAAASYADRNKIFLSCPKGTEWLTE